VKIVKTVLVEKSVLEVQGHRPEFLSLLRIELANCPVAAPKNKTRQDK